MRQYHAHDIYISSNPLKRRKKCFPAPVGLEMTLRLLCTTEMKLATPISAVIVGSKILWPTINLKLSSGNTLIITLWAGVISETNTITQEKGFICIQLLTLFTGVMSTEGETW